MARPSARQILAELLPVSLVLLCLAGGLALVITTHRRFPPEPKPVAAVQAPAPAPTPVVAAVESRPEPDLKPIPVPKPAPEPPGDPTGPILEDLARQIAEERAKAHSADQNVLANEKAIDASRAEVERLSRQESLVKARAKELDHYAEMLEREADLLARHRDVLAQKRDQETREFARLQTRSKDSFAVLPYRGENGTWRRPIAIECRNGTAKLQPDGREYGMLELADSLSLRGCPLVTDVARKLIEASAETPPDGARVVPYILFVIRPDGVRAYYEARGQLERLGIAFGYELVGDDLPIDYPSADDPMHWSDGEPPPGDVLAQAGMNPSSNPYVWPQAAAETPRSGLSEAEMEALNARNGSRPQPGPQGRSGPFPNLRDGPPIHYVPDPRPLARGGGLPPDGAYPGGISAPGSGRNGSGSGPLHPTPERGYGSASTSRSGENRGASGTGLTPDGLALQPVPTAPGSNTGAYHGSGLSPNPTPEAPGGSLSGGPEGPRPGPFPTTQPGLLAGTTGAGPKVGNGTTGSVGGTTADGSTVVSRPNGSGSPNRGTSRPGGSGTPPDVTPGSTSLGGSSGVNPLGAVVARALAHGGGPGDQGGSRAPTSPEESPSDLTRKFREELASSVRGGSLGQGEGHGQGDQAGEGESQGQGSESSPSGSKGSGGSSGGNGAPGMVSTTSHPAPWMTDKNLAITLSCDPSGVLIQPGGYRLSRGALETTHLLHDRLKAIVANTQAHAHGQPVKPRVQFVIEPGGEETFWLVRRQTVFADTDWPATVRLVESGGLNAFSGRSQR